jgi:class 3 adenylate cyclase/ligand-binding sensor domain-containing protein
MKPRLAIISFVLLLLFVKVLPVFCQQIIFNKVLPPEGRFNPLVTCITQDIKGYMWFASPSGLFRYDGYHLSTYVHDNSDPHSLASNYVESIFADSDGIIWAGTDGAGLDRLDPETGIFTHFNHHVDVPSSLGCDTITAILVDKQGLLWIGTKEGMDQFDPKTNKFIHYRNHANDSTSISNNLVRAIYEDRQGTLWIGTGIPGDGRKAEEGGLNRMNKKSGTFTRYLNIPGNIHSLANNKVRAIFEDNEGVLWIGTAGNGLHKMDRQKGTFERIVFDPAHPEKISGPALKKESSINELINFITQDVAGSYWIGSLEGGLNYYNPVIGKTIHYPGTENSSGVYNDKGAWWTFTSRDGMLWISSDWTRGNLYRIDPFRREIPHYLIPGGIVCFYEEPNGIFWTAGEELIRNDIDKGIAKRYKIINPTTEAITIIKEDRQGNFWVGTGGGLKLFNKEKENLITYRYDPENKRSLSNNDVHTIYVDIDSNVWIGTHRGFNLWNSKTASFTQYFINPNDTSLRGQGAFPVSAFLRDNTGKLWVGEWGGGVNLFNQKDNNFKKYLKGTQVSCLYEDADATLWLGANNGLYKYDRSADAFILFKVSGLLAEIPDISRMVEDNQKYLWLQTSDGMMSVNPQRNETKNYGISKTSFQINNKNYCYKGRDGKLYFTETGGYYSFYPTDFTQHVKPPEIIFTGFSLGDQLIKVSDKGPLKESISKTTEIRLRYNQNIFSFEFAAIDYTNPESNQHLFMLENYDNKWQQAGSDRKASYFNIPPGKYIFRVKAINSKGAWAEKKINIIILPPWWQTWWFRILAGITLLLLFFGFYRWRTAALRKQKRILEQTVKERTAELVEEKAEVERQKEKSDELLLNILPSEVAEELKEKGYTTAKSFDEVTVLFSDIKGFTNVAEKMTAQELVKEIDTYFSAFDNIILKYGLEKIKTIGDAYIAAGGLPEKNSATAQNVVEAAIAMQQTAEKLKQERISLNKPYFELRIGIHTGPVVAGVVGIKKFQYDIWGDTVNLAARMEQSGVPGKINISQQTHELVKEQFNCVHRGKIEAKNKGDIDMYFVE